MKIIITLIENKVVEDNPYCSKPLDVSILKKLSKNIESLLRKTVIRVLREQMLKIRQPCFSLYGKRKEINLTLFGRLIQF